MCSTKFFASKNGLKSQKVKGNALEIIKNAKCKNKAEQSPKEYFFLQNAGLTTSNFTKEILAHFKFCKNCYKYINSNKTNEFHYDSLNKKKINKC